ncbi:SDR family oxidoreductase [Mucilaginibacter pedocola]|uniref:NmrA family transcriptional regulator n=1 Tax=Mucilaginibacter pedocola TaxID=1792845 RepID=A0A1S9PA60_9SPHI|nr:NAD(P)H-binding protein [Mucilaginibacter pedocola]OOQ57842.1 NmrA family transcriptional regulator [Mucilaginibacter pedocola]
MKILIIGATGLIGSKVAQKLQSLGHSVVAGSSSKGINALTGAGLEEALKETDVLIDLINSPSFEEGPAVEFFTRTGNNLVGAAKAAGIKHYVILSIVGTDLMQNIGYMKAKKVQEGLVKGSGVPYTIIRSAQFHEFVPVIADIATQENRVHVSTLDFQPIAAEDVAGFVTGLSVQSPLNSIVDIAGPERKGMSAFVEDYLSARQDSRVLVPNDRCEYIGIAVPQSALVPDNGAKLGGITFADWISGQSA